jgi:hypothetical protein
MSARPDLFSRIRRNHTGDRSHLYDHEKVRSRQRDLVRRGRRARQIGQELLRRRRPASLLRCTPMIATGSSELVPECGTGRPPLRPALCHRCRQKLFNEPPRPEDGSAYLASPFGGPLQDTGPTTIRVVGVDSGEPVEEESTSGPLPGKNHQRYIRKPH